MNYWVITARIEIYTLQLTGETDPAFAKLRWSHCVRLELGRSTSFQIPRSKTPPFGGALICGPPGAGHINIYLIVFIDINFDN